MVLLFFISIQSGISVENFLLLVRFRGRNERMDDVNSVETG